jgi:hypothetical protein
MLKIRPYVLCSFDYRCRYSGDEGSVYGYFTGEVDGWGKHTVVHLRDLEQLAEGITIAHDRDDDGVLQCRVKLPELTVKLYLFEGEIGEIYYQDEVTRGDLHREVR